MKKIKTIFFGTPEIAASALEALLSNPRFEVVAAVTQPDRPVGRKKTVTPPPVKAVALKHGLAVFQPEKLRDQAVQDEILSVKPELSVVVAYGNLIPKRLLEAVPMGFVNVHPSLLPKHRGASPLTAAILDGDAETGVCLMVLDEQMDHGPIIACRRVPLAKDETTGSLRMKITPIASDLLGKELVEYIGGHMVSVSQDHGQATFCKPITTEAARIDWARPLNEIDRQVRAMHGIEPAWTMLHSWETEPVLGITAAGLGSLPKPDDVKIMIHRVKIIDIFPEAKPPGTIIVIDKKPAVACANGFLILEEMQLSGGKPMSGQAFLNGHKDIVGKKLA
jgi:methionyl-tRNA formyltransferase